MKTLQITDEALHNAHRKGCKEVKETLELLFPEEFKKESKIDWSDLYANPTKYILFDDRYDTDVLAMHPVLANEIDFGCWDASYKNRGYPKGWKGQHCSLNQVVEFLNKVLEKNK